MYPSSVVQTGVKFFGCENRMAHPFPIHSWKLIRPCVVSAVKLGASLLILNAMTYLPHRVEPSHHRTFPLLTLAATDRSATWLTRGGIKNEGACTRQRGLPPPCAQAVHVIP